MQLKPSGLVKKMAPATSLVAEARISAAMSTFCEQNGIYINFFFEGSTKVNFRLIPTFAMSDARKMVRVMLYTD